MCADRSAGGSPQPTGRPWGQTSSVPGHRAGAVGCAEQAPREVRISAPTNSKSGPVGGVTLRGVPCYPLVPRLPLPPPRGSAGRAGGLRGAPKALSHACTPSPCRLSLYPAPPQNTSLILSPSPGLEFGWVLPGAWSCPESEVPLVPREQTGPAVLWVSPAAMPRLVLPYSRNGCGQERPGPALQVLASL